MKSKLLTSYIKNLDKSKWDPVIKSNGTESQMSSHRTTHNISDYKKPFTLVIQRTPKSGQLELDIGSPSNENESNGYVYCAIAISLDLMSDNEVIS